MKDKVPGADAFLMYLDDDYGNNNLLKFTWKEKLHDPVKFFKYRYSAWKINRIVNKWIDKSTKADPLTMKKLREAIIDQESDRIMAEILARFDIEEAA